MRPGHFNTYYMTCLACLGFMVFQVVSTSAALGQARENRMVEGVVVDSKTRHGIQGANVFIEGTTIGTSSDKNGKFGFQIPPRLNEFSLVISFVGYQSQKHVISHTAKVVDGDRVFPTYRIELEESAIELGNIEVRASDKEWRKNLKRFKLLAFSNTENSGYCEIDHPEYLSFEIEDSSNALLATTTEPFVFQNTALGYAITIHDFSLEGSDSGYKWTGSLQFRELESDTASDHEKWEVNRFKSFHGSSRHFVSTVVAGTAFKEGFRIALVDRPGLRFEERDALSVKELVNIVEVDSTYSSIQFPQVLAIRYSKEAEAKSYATYQASESGKHLKRRFKPSPSQMSWLALQDDMLIVDPYGNEYGTYAAIRYGFWAFERLCDILPTDFELR